MQLKTMEAVSVVHQIRCDRCGKETERGELGFAEMTSIGFDAGYDSIFGDGNRVEVATKLAAFKPEVHGGEFPPPKSAGPG